MIKNLFGVVIMNSSLINSIIERENNYRSLLRKAKNYREITGKSSETECKLLQKAADIKAEIIQLTANPGGTEAEKRSHEIELAELNNRISQIRKELAPQDFAVGNNKGNAASNGTPSQAQEYDPDEINTSTWYKSPPNHNFDNVSGMEDVKNKLRNCMIDAELEKLAQRLKMKLLNSFFFVGPPGCGKTYIIEAFIRELMDKQNYKYIALNGADIISKYVGDAEKIVERLFDEAVKSAPCVVFLDEIDGVCKNRSLQALPEYAASITTAFLTGYNKINSSDSKIIFIGATNYPKKVDSAMMDRVEVVMVGLPDKEAREFAFSMHFKELIALDDDIDFAYMAKRTEGFNYRDIDRVVENIKKTIFNDMSEVLRSEGNIENVSEIVENAVKSLDEGRFLLDKERFDTVIECFTPSNKADIINDIDEWLLSLDNDYEGEAREDSDVLPKERKPTDDAPKQHKEFENTEDDIPKQSEESQIGNIPALKNSEETDRLMADIEQLAEELDRRQENAETENTASINAAASETTEETNGVVSKIIGTTSTIAPAIERIVEKVFFNPSSGLITVVFRIVGAVLPKVIAAFDGFNYVCKQEKEDTYSFSFKPEDTIADHYTFDLTCNRGYIGTLDAKTSDLRQDPHFDI